MRKGRIRSRMSHISVFKTPGPLKLGKAHDDEKKYTIVIIPTEKRTQPDIFFSKGPRLKWKNYHF